MTSDDPVLFCLLDCLSFSLCPLMTPFSFVHWVVYPSLYDLWWPLSLFPIGCLPREGQTKQWTKEKGVIGGHKEKDRQPNEKKRKGSSEAIKRRTDNPFLFCPLLCLSFSLWPLMTPFSLVHWVVCPSLYDLWWPLSLLSIGLSVLLFMASDDSFLFGPLGCLSSLWPLMTPFSFVHWP
jgi:hypothetical protein